MTQAKLNSEFIATVAGDITVYNYDNTTREYISSSTEYLAVGVGIPACSCLDAPVTHKAGYAICRSADFNSWEYVPDHRGEIIYSTETGESKEITAPGDYPENTTTIAPLTPFDKWDGEKWVTDTEAQHSAALDAAEAKRQSLIDAAMASISLIQMKLRAGRKLTQAETTRLNAVLDYIDAVEATDTSTAPDVTGLTSSPLRALRTTASRSSDATPLFSRDSTEMVTQAGDGLVTEISATRPSALRP